MNNIMIPYEDDFLPIEVETGLFVKRFIKQNLEGKIRNYQAIVNSSLNTISQFTLSNGKDFENIKVGLAFGKVQSGKTTYFLCSSACALDNGFDLIIILSGVTRNLLQQNWKRLKNSFKRCKTTLGLVNSSKLETNINEAIEDIEDYFSSFEEDNVNGGVIFSVLKNDTHLVKIRTIVEHFKDKRILVIDDEGDQFSMNTMINKEKESTTFRLIRDIVYSSENISLLTVTATPQAPLFSYVYNELSPDFVEIVESGVGYCGLETFHSNSDFIEHITGDETSNKNELFEAIVYYLFTIYESEINSQLKYEKEFNWMLIHNSRLTSVHLNDFKELNDIIIFDLLPISNIKDFNRLDKTESKNIKKIKKLYKKYNISGKFNYDFTDFLENFKFVLNHIFIDQSNHNIKIINSTELDRNDELQPTKCGILIGGDMLGRGITIDGLTVSYLTRDTVTGKGNIDTILQRARWFGYRENTINLTKIFTTPEIESKFVNIYKHDMSLYDELKFCVYNNIPLKESKLPSTITDNLNPTRSNVIKKGYLSRFRTTDFIQQRIVNCGVDYELHKKVNSKIMEFLNKHDYVLEIKDIKKYKVNSLQFLNILSDYIDNDDILTINERLYESLKLLLNSKLEIDVLVMKEIDGKSRGYSLTKNDSFKKYYNIFMGNVLPGAGSNEYLGDSYHFNDFSHIQIHFTKINDSKGNPFYEGERILFLCVNNNKSNNAEFIKRVL